MSDSPLDGGSGWPTSAYSIVPAPRPAPPPEKFDDDEDDGGAEGVAVVEPEAPLKRGKGLLVAALVALVVALVAAGAVVLVTRKSSHTSDSRPQIGPQQILSPTPQVATTVSADSSSTVTPSGSGAPGASDAPSAGGTPSAGGGPTPGGTSVPGAGAATTDVLRTGSVRLANIGGQADDKFDFDSGTKTGTDPDVDAAPIGLNATGSAAFALWTLPAAPTLDGCASLPAAVWTGTLMLSTLMPGTTVCVRTSDQRNGMFVSRPILAPAAGEIYATQLDYTVWRKAGD